MALRQVLPLAVVIGLAWLLKDRFAHLNIAEVGAAVSRVSPAGWVMALLATAASFWAVGRYDGVIHALLGTGTDRATARRSGAAAIAVAQFTGFGVLTGALVRWRLLPDVGLWQATRISLAVSVSFLAGLAVVLALTTLAAHPEARWMSLAAIAVLVGLGTVLALSLLRPNWCPDLPPVRMMLAIVLLAAIDTGFAALAFYAVLPGAGAIAPATFLLAFLMAFGAGLMGGTPGGVGPFEMVLLSVLTVLPAEDVIGAALAFRLTYLVVPALVGAVVLALGKPAASDAGDDLPVAIKPNLSPDLAARIWTADRAETNLLRLPGTHALRGPQGAVATIASTGQSMVMLGDPLNRATSPETVWPVLSQSARTAHRVPLVYKCGAHGAVAARRAGWAVVAIATEMWLNPQVFSTESPACRQLRRQLRKAESAGVALSAAGRRLPEAEMARVADVWARDHGGERGFSMGQFDIDYLRHQRVFLAHHDGRLVAYASFHECAREWTLDLMRHDGTAPPGTMQALIGCAIGAAKAAGVARLSLAAVPIKGCGDGTLGDRIRIRADSLAGGEGLRRFKGAFAPHHETLYAAAPTRAQLVLGLWDVSRAVNRAPRRQFYRGLMTIMRGLKLRPSAIGGIRR